MEILRLLISGYKIINYSGAKHCKKSNVEMKKLMVTADEYYNRKTEANFLEEELQSLRGCQSLFILLLVTGTLIGLLILGLIFS